MGLAEKVNFFNENGFEIGPLIHDDVPCAPHSEWDMKQVEKELTLRLQTNVPDYTYAKVESEYIVAPSYETGAHNDLEAAQIINKLHPQVLVA